LHGEISYFGQWQEATSYTSAVELVQIWPLRYAYRRNAMQDTNPSEPRRLRGFAAMSPEKKREIAGMGGRAAHAAGRAHQFSTEEARAAGKKRHQVAEKAG
jgi:general stress protein YciG